MGCQAERLDAWEYLEFFGITNGWWLSYKKKSILGGVK